LGVVGTKGDLGELGAFDYIPVHFFVAGVIASFAAGGVEDDFTGSFAGRDVVMNLSALRLKRTFDRMHVADERDVGVAVRGVKLQIKCLRRLGR